MVAVTTTHFFTVSKEQFLEILNDSSITLRYLQSVAKQRLKRTPSNSATDEEKYAVIEHSGQDAHEMEPLSSLVINPDSK